MKGDKTPRNHHPWRTTWSENERQRRSAGEPVGGDSRNRSELRRGRDAGRVVVRHRAPWAYGQHQDKGMAFALAKIRQAGLWHEAALLHQRIVSLEAEIERMTE